MNNELGIINECLPKIYAHINRNIEVREEESLGENQPISGFTDALLSIDTEEDIKLKCL